jgi:hypothetical protein
MGLGGYLVRHRNELVGGLAAGGEHGDDRAAVLARLHHAPRRADQPLGVGHRGPAELHHDYAVGVLKRHYASG